MPHAIRCLGTSQKAASLPLTVLVKSNDLAAIVNVESSDSLGPAWGGDCGELATAPEKPPSMTVLVGKEVIPDHVALIVDSQRHGSSRLGIVDQHADAVNQEKAMRISLLCELADHSTIVADAEDIDHIRFGKAYGLVDALLEKKAGGIATVIVAANDLTLAIEIEDMKIAVAGRGELGKFAPAYQERVALVPDIRKRACDFALVVNRNRGQRAIRQAGQFHNAVFAVGEQKAFGMICDVAAQANDLPAVIDSPRLCLSGRIRHVKGYEFRGSGSRRGETAGDGNSCVEEAYRY